MELQVVGGGLAGLIAAVEAAERGARVRLVEAHTELGGRARASSPPHVAHEGPHVLYRDGPTWAWLTRRQLVGGTSGVPVRALNRFWFRRAGRLRRVPPRGLLQVLAARGPAPVERSFAAWAGDRWGPARAAEAAAASGVATYHHDPGSLSARFVQERLQRAFGFPAQAVYVHGGWPVLVERLAAAARQRGVQIETGRRVTVLPRGGPVVLAVPLASARLLLGDDGLRQPSGATALVDVGVGASRGDAFVVSDIDTGGWLERFSLPDPSLVPPGESLVQAQVPFGPDDRREVALGRVETLLDAGVPGWRRRLTWRRDALARGRTGAVDLPGRTWRDRPAVDRGGDVFLAGDEVAAPGMLSEVSCTSAVAAVDAALSRARLP
ncbi:Phytoene dehydrogenase-related protein [Friedmanniella luteola]|uniref:Phytoene dehydrogenase-related protein n=1 Tax=Friedmanniella luteola TaxID=546871 RepID=A0A1H1QZV3_9ACTN|nr:FAD-dependent oxidoreductase [Friedmanniella luteola]SDS28795.1 Phytoene dehydrogenase-related protein [Friedmanniella luteola]